ncbi:hypothetical protein ACYCS5_00130 [Paenibacillus sp. SEL3]
MNHTYKVSKSDIELFVDALGQVRVYVVQLLSDELITVVDYGGAVEKFSPDAVKINESYFFRKQFEFRVDLKEPTKL